MVFASGCRIIEEMNYKITYRGSVKKYSLEDWKYLTLLGSCADQLRENFGHSETLYACNTYQFSDYSRYAMTVFKEEDKRKYRDEHFPQDLKNAYELGKRLVAKCRNY